MSLPSCARCGAPLAATPTDPAHPEWCRTCATAALQGPPAAPTPPPTAFAGAPMPQPSVPTAAGALPLGVDRPTLVVRTRVLDGLIVGTATAVLAAVAWWAISSRTELEWWTFGAALVGLIIGQGVLLGARKGGVAPGIIAAILGVAVVALAVYFIDRSQTIAALTDDGRSSDIPLWQGATAFWDALKGWFDYDRTKTAGFLLAPLLALVIAVRPNARPLIARR